MKISIADYEDYLFDHYKSHGIDTSLFMKLVEEHTNDIQKITCPTLILWGTKDEIVPKDSVNYVFDNISSKSVTLFEIKTLTHDLFINDRYEDVKKIITFFLRKNPKRKKEKFKI